jgi:hypothetical protein
MEEQVMPNRIIKESVCYSDDLDRLSAFEETVFYRLIVNCDDYGRIDARPSFLKSKLFVTKKGITEKNISDAISRLASVGLVQLYEVDEKPFLLFPKWGFHQRVRNSREKYPSPELAANCGDPPQKTAIIQSNPIQSESESEYVDKPQRNQFIPPTIKEITEYCQERNKGVDPENWIDHYTANGWMVGKTKMKDWKAAVRTWEKNTQPNGAPTDQQKQASAEKRRQAEQEAEAIIEKERQQMQKRKSEGTVNLNYDFLKKVEDT